MVAKQYIKVETPEAIYELYMAATQKSVADIEQLAKMEIYRPLGERALAEQGSLEGVYEVIGRMRLLLRLESRKGNIRHKYPHLQKHEIVELLYNAASSINI